MSLRANCFFDGGSRGNPGLAGYAVVLTVETDPDNPIEVARLLDHPETNNVAEYEGLCAGLRIALVRGVEDIQMVSDSKLVVEQVLGTWAVKEPRLKILCAEAREMATRFAHSEIMYVPREQNKQAYMLVTDLLDEHSGRKRK